MNREAIGAFEEVAGALGVLGTLIFLIIQIRQNSELVRNNTLQPAQRYEFAKAQAIGESNSQQDAMLAIAQGDALAQILHQGMRNYGELAPLFRLRFALVMGALIGGVATQAERQISLGVYGNDMAPPTSVICRLFIINTGDTGIH